MFVLEDPSPPPPELLAELATLVDKLVALDAPGLHPDDRSALLIGLARETGRVAALQAVLAHAADQAGDWTRVGATSGRLWLAELTHTSVHDAREQLRLGAALTRLRSVCRAALEGDLSSSAVELLATTAAPDTLSYALRDEELLLEQALKLRLAQLARFVAHWRHRAKAEADDERAPDPQDRRSFRLGRASDGFGLGRVVLDPEALDAVERALATLAGTPEPGDRRSAHRRRGDALFELCDAFNKGLVPGGRGASHLTVLVPIHDLVTDPDEPWRSGAGPCGPGPRTTDGTPVHTHWLARLLCNSPLRRVVVDADGMPLDVGRDERFATPAIWHALVVRDGGCSHPWCDRPPGWCEAHHVTGDWDNPSTRTAVDQMTLACERHHHLVHEGGWHVSVEHGRPVWYDPMGTPVHGPP